jgi:hypothetical protein
MSDNNSALAKTMERILEELIYERGGDDFSGFSVDSSPRF